MAVTRTSKELRRAQNERSDVQNRLQRAEQDLKLRTSELEKERMEHKDLNEQVFVVFFLPDREIADLRN